MKALILLGGDAPPLPLLREQLAWADRVICADGGAGVMDAIGAHPDVLLGDMDSIQPGILERWQAAGVDTLCSPAEKDYTDGQLALDWAMEHGATEIRMLGGMGGTLDHMLGNVALALRAARRGVACALLDGHSRAWAATGKTSIEGRPGDIVSLLPLAGDASVRYLHGLQYGTWEPLALPADMPIGARNMLTDSPAQIDIEGWVLVVVVSAA